MPILRGPRKAWLGDLSVPWRNGQGAFLDANFIRDCHRRGGATTMNVWQIAAWREIP